MNLRHQLSNGVLTINIITHLNPEHAFNFPRTARCEVDGPLRPPAPIPTYLQLFITGLKKILTSPEIPGAELVVLYTNSQFHVSTR